MGDLVTRRLEGYHKSSLGFLLGLEKKTTTDYVKFPIDRMLLKQGKFCQDSELSAGHNTVSVEEQGAKRYRVPCWDSMYKSLST